MRSLFFSYAAVCFLLPAKRSAYFTQQVKRSWERHLGSGVCQLCQCQSQSASDSIKVPVSKCQHQSASIKVPVSKCQYQNASIKVLVSDCSLPSANSLFLYTFDSPSCSHLDWQRGHSGGIKTRDPLCWTRCTSWLKAFFCKPCKTRDPLNFVLTQRSV
jgi:hypothetical protein